jgi:hypothetical protein
LHAFERVKAKASIGGQRLIATIFSSQQTNLAMLEIRLLGQFEIRRDGAPVEIPWRSAQSLLAFLVLNAGAAQRRERLAGLLWPGSSEAKHG